ncbi:hypothetical protein C5167_042905 [Papaver somniferum]|uniref:Uncharacterized protein n=1 Tax=Papaver somniferum TaxID=3469 RepID=A0A4Y7L7Q4_PAPSO|nr:hypothetical protein C5167_042905 [Papaver somniferum]
MDAIKTIDFLKPYTQRRLYFRFGKRKFINFIILCRTSSILSAQAVVVAAAAAVTLLLYVQGNMDENPQPPAAKKVRGGAKLNFLNKLKKGEKVSLEFRRGAPVGPNANKISAYCGKLALNGENFPFDIPDWSDMPHKEEKLEEAIEELKNIFHYSGEINFWVEEKIHEKWKANKRNMRLEHFDEKKTDAQNRASCPNKVIDTQWANMLIYWCSPEFKKTYRAKEGKGDQYSKIMGAEKPGRIRGVGSTIKVTKLTGESSSNVVQNNEENAALRDEIKKLKEDQVHMQNDMEEERLEMKKTVDDMKKANEESQKKIDALLLLFAGRGTSHIQSHRVVILLHESEVNFIERTCSRCWKIYDN